MAALVYAVLGAADVALTEALVGTMLAITLYAVAVRSSLVMRLGVLKDELTHEAESDRTLGQLIDEFRAIFKEHYMRVELVPYKDAEELNQALMEKKIHATCVQQLQPEQNQQDDAGKTETPPYHTTTRLQRLYEIMQTELRSPATLLTYVNLADSGETH